MASDEVELTLDDGVVEVVLLVDDEDVTLGLEGSADVTSDEVISEEFDSVVELTEVVTSDELPTDEASDELLSEGKVEVLLELLCDVVLDDCAVEEDGLDGVGVDEVVDCVDELVIGGGSTISGESPWKSLWSPASGSSSDDVFSEEVKSDEEASEVPPITLLMVSLVTDNTRTESRLATKTYLSLVVIPTIISSFSLP